MALEPFDLVPLDHDWSWSEGSGGRPAPPPSPPRACDAVLLHTRCLGRVVVFWKHLDKQDVDPYEDGRTRHLHRRGLVLESLGERLLIGKIDAALVWALDELPADLRCE